MTPGLPEQPALLILEEVMQMPDMARRRRLRKARARRERQRNNAKARERRLARRNDARRPAITGELTEVPREGDETLPDGRRRVLIEG